MSKERRPRTPDEFAERREEYYRRALQEGGGHPGRQRRLKSLITERVELMLGFQPPRIPREIVRIVRGKLSDAALVAFWYSPNNFLWSDQEDPLGGDSRGRSPFEMWKELKYRAEVEDFMRVMADNLSPEITTK